MDFDGDEDALAAYVDALIENNADSEGGAVEMLRDRTARELEDFLGQEGASLFALKLMGYLEGVRREKEREEREAKAKLQELEQRQGQEKGEKSAEGVKERVGDATADADKARMRAAEPLGAKKKIEAKATPKAAVKKVVEKRSKVKEREKEKTDKERERERERDVGRGGGKNSRGVDARDARSQPPPRQISGRRVERDERMERSSDIRSRLGERVTDLRAQIKTSGGGGKTDLRGQLMNRTGPMAVSVKRGRDDGERDRGHSQGRDWDMDRDKHGSGTGWDGGRGGGGHQGRNGHGRNDVRDDVMRDDVMRDERHGGRQNEQPPKKMVRRDEAGFGNGPQPQQGMMPVPTPEMMQQMHQQMMAGGMPPPGFPPPPPGMGFPPGMMPGNGAPPPFVAGGHSGFEGGGGRGRGAGAFAAGRGRGGRGGRGGQAGAPGNARGRMFNSILVVRNVPKEQLTISHISDFFKKFGQVTNISLLPSYNPDHAFVHFAERKEAQMAHDSVDAVMGNRHVRLFWAREQDVGSDDVLMTGKELAPTGPVSRRGNQYQKGAPIPAGPPVPAEDPEVVLQRKRKEIAAAREKQLSAKAEHVAEIARCIAETKAHFAKLGDGNCSTEDKKNLMAEIKSLQAKASESRAWIKAKEGPSKTSAAPIAKAPITRPRGGMSTDFRPKIVTITGATADGLTPETAVQIFYETTSAKIEGGNWILDFSSRRAAESATKAYRVLKKSFGPAATISLASTVKSSAATPALSAAAVPGGADVGATETVGEAMADADVSSGATDAKPDAVLMPATSAQ